MLKSFLLAFALVAATPAAAQIILDDETTGGGQDGGGGGVEFPGCDACCATNPAWYCEGEYGCHCDDFGFCGAAAAMRSAGVAPEEIGALQKSLATLGARLLLSRSGRQTARLWLTYDDRVYQILRDDPALGTRVGKAIVTHWPAGADFTGSGGPADTARVSRAALSELRGLLTEIAKADAGPGTTGLAHVITAEVMPRLREGLAGRSPAEALACYLDGC